MFDCQAVWTSGPDNNLVLLVWTQRRILDREVTAGTEEHQRVLKYKLCALCKLQDRLGAFINCEPVSGKNTKSDLICDHAFWAAPWSSGQSSWLLTQRSGFDSRRCQLF
jgi:hypothetical protein